MIFVIQLAQHHDALHALLAGKEVEVEHHHLTLELCQRLVVALIIGQRDVDDARRRHLRGINLGRVLLARIMRTFFMPSIAIL